MQIINDLFGIFMKIRCLSFFFIVVFFGLGSTTLLAKTALQEAEFDTIMDLLNDRILTTEQKKDIRVALGKVELTPVKPKGSSPKTKLSPPDFGSPKRYKIGNTGKHLLISPPKMKGDTFDPETRKHNVVYIQTLTKDGYPLIKREERILFPKTVLVNKKWQETNKKNLNHALLMIENQIREWVKNNKDIFHKTTYVGLAKTFRKRAGDHGRDFNTEKAFDWFEEGDSGASLEFGKKVNFTIKAVELSDSDLRISPLVYDIPDQWLALVEVLVGTLLNSTMKAGTLLGNDEAKIRYEEYFASSVRKKGIKNEGVIEDLFEDTCRKVLGMDD